MSDEPKWKTNWLKKLENEFGVPWSEVRDNMSTDQVIGILRKMEQGKDPHAAKRMSHAEEITSLFSDTSTGNRQLYRDPVDEMIGISYRIGLFDFPPDRRGMPLTQSQKTALYEKFMSQKKSRDTSSVPKKPKK